MALTCQKVVKHPESGMVPEPWYTWVPCVSNFNPTFRSLEHENLLPKRDTLVVSGNLTLEELVANQLCHYIRVITNKSTQIIQSGMSSPSQHAQHGVRVVGYTAYQSTSRDVEGGQGILDINMYTYICIHYMYVHFCKCMNQCVYIYLHMYIYICICIYIYMYIYIYSLQSQCGFQKLRTPELPGAATADGPSDEVSGQ